MKKILILLFILILTCSCKINQNEINKEMSYVYKNVMLEQREDKVFCYKPNGKNTLLRMYDLSNGDVVDIHSQPSIPHPAFSIIDDKIYFIDSNKLYSKKLSDLYAEPYTEGVFGNKIEPSGFNLTYYIFKYGNSIYVQGRNLYRLENNSLKEVLQNITSVCLNGNECYFSDEQGNIYRAVDYEFNNYSPVVSEEQVEQLDDEYISILGNECYIDNLQVADDRIYFTISAGIAVPGQIYYYDIHNEKIIKNDQIIGKSVYSFAVKSDELICHGTVEPYKNALFKLKDNHLDIICEYSFGFSIIDNVMYYYDNNKQQIIKELIE